MSITRKNLQNCNFILWVFIILFGLVGLLNFGNRASANRIGEIDKQLDQYEIKLKQYQDELSEYVVQSSEYDRIYQEYEVTYDEYSKLFQERKDLYERQTQAVKFGLDSNILFGGCAILFIVFISINIVYKAQQMKKHQQKK